MKTSSRMFKAVDCLYILMMVLPLIFAIVLKIVLTPLSEGIDIRGADIYFVLPLPIQALPVTESQVNSLVVILSVTALCLFLTHGIQSGIWLKRHHIAELLVEKVRAIVENNMGDYFRGFAPFVTAILALSAFSSLLSLLGLYPPTSDVNIVGGWAVLVFVLITYYKCKCGPIQYLKSFGDPVPLLSPLNIISEVATPISMAFRHYGNVLSGAVISVLVATGLQGLTSILLGWLPGFLGEIPFLQIGIPAILSIYFDIFSGCLQAYIFAMLTMLYIANGFPVELYKKKQLKKHKKIVGGN